MKVKESSYSLPSAIFAVCCFDFLKLNLPMLLLIGRVSQRMIYLELFLILHGGKP